jgi:hypothetical protein
MERSSANFCHFGADDPRHELAFQAQLIDYSLQLRQEGGSVTDASKPGAPPIEWCSAPSS